MISSEEEVRSRSRSREVVELEDSPVEDMLPSRLAVL